MQAMSAISERLSTLGAHHDLISWAAAYGDDWQALFTACPRADWLLGLGARLGCERKTLVRAAIGCTRVGLSYLPDSNAEVQAALQAAEAWARGDAAADSCNAVRARLELISITDDAAADSVVQAAIATLSTITSPDAAAHAAACIAQAAVLAAGDCAMTSALRFTQERCADAVRTEITPAQLADLARNGA